MTTSNDAAGCDSLPISGHDGILTLSRRMAVIGLLVCLAISTGLLAKQIAFSRIATTDAASYYLPLARMSAAGDGISQAQHPMIPPLYPVLTGWLSRVVSRVVAIASDPQEMAGRLISAVSLLCVVICIYAIAAMLWNARVALIAAALTCANRYMVSTGANVGPDMLYALLLTLTVWLLLLHMRRVSFLWSALACGCAAMAAVTRSEGIFLVPVAIVVVVLVSWRSLAGKRRWLIAPHLIVLLVLIAAIWTPRISYMKQNTGSPLLDVRMARYIPGFELDADLRLHPGQIARIDLRKAGGEAGGGAGVGRKFGAAVNEAFESIFMVNNPLTWSFIIGWLFFGRRIFTGRRAEQSLIIAVVLIEVCLILTVKANARYFTFVAGLVQIWGALGVVALAEWIRTSGKIKWQPLRRMAASIKPQLVGLGAILIFLCAWSLLSTNTGTRSAELRDLGVIARQRSGSDSVFLAGSSETAYYAAGRVVTVIKKGKVPGELSPQLMADICRERSVDYIVIRTKETWAPWLLERAAAGDLPAGAIVASADDTARSKFLRTYLIDARALLAGISK